MRINCPFCGLRDHSEFSFGGESAQTRPADPDRASDVEWADYLFYRDNVKGLHLERWVHNFGCRQWFNVVRDTATHEIVEVVRMGNPVKTPLAGKGNASG